MDEIIAVIRKLPKPQRDALDWLAINQPPHAPQRVLIALENKGLIVGCTRTSRDRFGLMTWTEYVVPIPIHIAWCAVCSEEWDAMTPEEQAKMEAPDA